MDTQKSPNRIHPLMAAAAVSVILASVVGIAAMTGILPTSHSSNSPKNTISPQLGALDNYVAPDKDSLQNAEPIGAPPSPIRAESPRIAQAGAYPQAAMQLHESGNTAMPAQASVGQQTPVQYSTPRPVAQVPQICKTCGRVESVKVIHHQARPTGVGLVAGAVLGGVLGNQVGGGNGRSLATVGGAVGGGYVGNEIEKRNSTAASYQVRVRMQDGRTRYFNFAAQPGWNTGDEVRVVNGRLSARG